MGFSLSKYWHNIQNRSYNVDDDGDSDNGDDRDSVLMMMMVVMIRVMMMIMMIILLELGHISISNGITSTKVVATTTTDSYAS